MTDEQAGYTNIIEVANRALELVLEANGINKSEGGYLSLFGWQLMPNTPILVTLVGHPHFEKLEELFKLSLDNGKQQSRDTSQQCHNGAIVAKEFVISFTGLPDVKADEALTLTMACMRGLLEESEAQLIADVNRNEMFQPAMALYNKELTASSG